MRQNKISIDQLLNSVGEEVKVLGKKDRYVSAASPIDKASSESVTFCSKKAPEGLQMVRNSKAGFVICRDDLEFTEDDFRDKTLIMVSNPRLAFMRIMRKHFVEERKYGISPTAVIDEAVRIHPSVYIGPNSYIGRCEIGENTVIYGNVYIYPGAVIGRNVVIHAGAVIGPDGNLPGCSPGDRGIYNFSVSQGRYHRWYGEHQAGRNCAPDSCPNSHRQLLLHSFLPCFLF